MTGMGVIWYAMMPVATITASRRAALRARACRAAGAAHDANACCSRACTDNARMRALPYVPACTCCMRAHIFSLTLYLHHIYRICLLLYAHMPYITLYIYAPSPPLVHMPALSFMYLRLPYIIQQRHGVYVSYIYIYVYAIYIYVWTSAVLHILYVPCNSALTFPYRMVVTYMVCACILTAYICM